MNEAAKVRGVLFDATGTLFDSKESVGTVYSRLARPQGIDLPARRIDAAFSRIMAEAPARVFPGLPPDEIAERERDWWRNVVRSTFLATDSTVEFPDFVDFFAQLYAYYETAEAWSLRAGARQALQDLRRRGIATGVVSNFDQRLHVILQALEISDFLPVVIIPAGCGFEKPSAAIFEAALEAIAVPAAAVIFVGDHPVKDRAAAEKVGMRSLDPGSMTSLAELPDRI